MKLLIFAKAFFPSIGGMEVSTRSMARELVRLGHEVKVFTATVLGGTDELEEGYIIIRSSSVGRLFLECNWAERLIIRGGVSAAAGFCGLMLRKPICVVHELSGSFLHAGDSVRVRTANRIRQRVFLEASLHLGVSRACVASKGLATDKRQVVLYNPVDFGMASHDVERSKKVHNVLYVGRVLAAKGIFVLLEALERIDRNGIRLTVAIAGDGEALPHARALANEFSNVDVVFMGGVRHEMLAKLYVESEVVVVPTTVHPEGMGMVIAEAFSFGVPVIGSDLPAIREVVGDGGILTPPGDSTRLAQVISDLVCDYAKRQALSANARRRSYIFSLEEYRCNLKGALDQWVC